MQLKHLSLACQNSELRCQKLPKWQEGEIPISLEHKIAALSAERSQGLTADPRNADELWVLFYNSSIVAAKQITPSDNFPLNPRLQLQNNDSKFDLYLFEEDWEKISMPKDQLQSIMPDKILGQLQELLLKAVLLGQQLPGTERPIRFPDLPFILRQSPVLLINENLANSISIKEVSAPVHILSQETLPQEARTRGDIAYLHFQPPRVEDDIVQLTIEAKICPRNPGQPILGLSGVQVMFQKVSGEWQVVGEPIIFSS